jgi:glycerol-3-phosphate dehydrogenase
MPRIERDKLERLPETRDPVTASLSTPARDQTLDRLERERFDCLVIGGGISGAGVAREAAISGLSVALLEAEDYASGTSSRSSKLIHGGLRYLAMGDVGLVRTTALERKVIFGLAPHLAEPRWMVVPVRSWAGLLKMRAGITTYEKLGAVEGDDLHRNWSGEEIEAHEPAIDIDVFKHACVYREYLTDDAHLVLANLRSASARGAAVLNHAPVDALSIEDGRASGAEAQCKLSGRRIRVRARCIINAAGPWIEPVRRLEDPDAPALLHLSKGVHIVLRAESLPVNNMVVCNTADRRTIFAIRHGEITYVGTTDTTYEPGRTYWPEVTGEDVDYLLEPLARTFRTATPTRDDVVSAWAGLRPLIAEPGKKPQEISRRDEVLIGPGKVVTMAGGKLTGYRPMARETLEVAASECGLTLAPASDEREPLPGGDFDGELGRLEAELVASAGVPHACARRMVRLYGTEAASIAAMGTEPLVPGSPVLASEVDWAVTQEGAATLEDVIYRRLRTALYSPDTEKPSVEAAARRMSGLLGWEDARVAREIGATRGRMAADLSFRDDA